MITEPSPGHPLVTSPGHLVVVSLTCCNSGTGNGTCPSPYPAILQNKHIMNKTSFFIIQTFFIFLKGYLTTHIDVRNQGTY